MEFAMSAVGGALIGLAASILLVANGRIAGVSGMVAGVVPPQAGEWPSRALFIAGLMIAGAVASLVAPEVLGSSPRSLGWLALAGVLVGVGTRLGSGCTSGHGVCGISRGSGRSIVATCVFMAVATVTVTVLRVLGVGA